MKETIGILWAICWGAIALCLHLRYGLARGSLAFVLAFAIVGGLAIANYNIVKRWKALGVEVETARKEIETAKDTAIKEMDEEISRLKDSTALLIRNANDTRERLEETIKMAAPPTLSFFSKEITKTDDGYDVILKLKPSKNENLGKVGFFAKIVGESSAKITDLWTGKGYVCLTGPDSKRISDDGKEARLIYSSISADWPIVRLKLSDACTVSISGSHRLNAFTLDIK